MGDEQGEGDAAVLGRWAAGDRAAGAVLFARHAPALTDFLARKHDGDIADLVQQSFVAALEAARAGREIHSVRGYLFRCARNALVDLIAARSRTPFDPAIDSLDARGTTPSQHALRGEQHALVHAALRRLGLDDQMALELYYWHELPVDDIAAAMGLGRSATLSRLHRARARLRAMLDETPAAAVDRAASLRSIDRALPEL